MASMALKDRVEQFMRWLFKGFRPRIPRGPKVINDSLLGNQYFANHEIAIIDTPLLQRLRRIYQTGLVHHVYPSARHSRFEHSLGVVTLAERCFNAIQTRARMEGDKLDLDEDRGSGDLAHLRLAALLHDVGHGLCSHAAEQIYEFYHDLEEFREDPRYVKNAPGEVLSHMMVTSETFRTFVSEVVNEACGANIDLDLVGELILGRHPDPERYFLAQIISGPHDADKLDYIARDSYYCGLALTVDLPRFYSMIGTARHEHGHRVLALRSYVPLEQILFSKMTLFGSVYHQQKVKCLDSTLRALIGHIIKTPDAAVIIGGKTISFSNPVEFLYTTDDDFFSAANSTGDDHVQEVLSRFRRRDLLVRCVEVSRRSVANWREAPGRKPYIDMAKDSALHQKVEGAIFEKVSDKCAPGEVLLSVPREPSLNVDNAFVQTQLDGPLEQISDFFPIEQWVTAYTHNKWRSYVYAPPAEAASVREAAVSVIKEWFDLDIDVPKSDRACHV